MGKTQRNAIVLLVPGVVFYTVALEMRPEASADFGLQVYGFIIYLCCYVVLGTEYFEFFDLHKAKDIAIDTLILTGASLGVRYFISNVTDLPKALWGMDIFLLFSCVWQVYTMTVNNYFDTGRSSWTSWFRLLAEPLFPFRGPPVETLHRDEYRYWLIVDGAQMLILTAVLLLYPSVVSAMSDFAKLLFAVIFVIGQLINVFRYRRVVTARKEMRRKEN